jgi:hypothetical protein
MSKKKTVRFVSYREREDEIERLNRLLRASHKRLRQERAKWDEKCPKGHLIRYDECDLVDCYVTPLPSTDTAGFAVLPKSVAPGIYHEWIESASKPPWFVRRNNLNQKSVPRLPMRIFISYLTSMFGKKG